MNLEPGTDGKKRCFGNRPGQRIYADYHDFEWGKPEHDERRLFEMLILEGAQAGLSWLTVLQKREGYRQAFHDFDAEKVASMNDEELEALRDFPGIVRNRLKIFSARKNARAVLKIREEHGSFDRYLWDRVDGKSIFNSWNSRDEIPANTALSDAISKDLKKKGMSFVGTTIVYALMQSVGMVDDHLNDCWIRNSSR